MATTTPSDAYALSDDQVAFRDTIRQIVRERVEPRAAEIDAKAEYPWDLRTLFAEHDLLGLPFETEYGGTGTGALTLNIAIEEIAKACASSALILMVQELGTLPIRLFGSDELKARFLPKCASGEWSPAFALSEPEAGSDPGGMITSARRDGDEWVINGTKNWITNLGIADFYVVFAVTSRGDARDGLVREGGGGTGTRGSRESRRISAFVVESDRRGFSVGKVEHKLGIRGAPTGQPIFEDVRIPHWAPSTTRASASPRRRLASPRERRTTPPPTLASASSSAGRSTSSRRSSSSWPTWRRARPRPASCSTRRAPRSTATSPTWASTPPWPSCSPPTPRWR
jgi:alkylation response protein AidB-like acyl-CoA dehydrogenase